MRRLLLRAPKSSGLVQKVGALLRERAATVSIQGDRALIELRDVGLDELPRLQARLEVLTSALPEVLWVEINPFVRHAVFALDLTRCEGVDSADVLHDLTALVRMAEAEQRALDRASPRDTQAAGHQVPDDPALRLRRWIELLADVGGLGLGLTLRWVPMVPSTAAAQAAFVLSAVQTQPRLRRWLDRRLGTERADLFLNLAMSFAQGVSRRPLSSLVDIGYRVSVLRELSARKDAFSGARAELFRVRAHHDLSPEAVAPIRPTPAPDGPLEAYRDRVGLAAGTAFAVSLLTSRSPSRAVSALFSALPTPAKLGRDLFALEVGRALGNRGGLVLQPDALRHLDRIDCMVLDGRLLMQARFRVSRVVPQRDDADGALSARVHALFDARQPIEVQQRGGFRLGPAAMLGITLEGETDKLAHELAASGSLVLSLVSGRELLAVVEVEIGKRSGAEELLFTAQRGGLRVVVATDEPSALSHLGHDYEMIPAGDQLLEGIQRLQRDGSAVALVSDGPSAALSAADCGIGIHRSGEVPPWGAHVICGPSLDELRTLLQACLMSHGVSKQSVNLAMGATAVGTVVSAGAAQAVSRRVMFVVNVASVASMINAMRHSAPLSDERADLLPDPTPWHALERESVLARLGSQEGGLRNVDAMNRRKQEPAPPSALRELGKAVSEELFSPLAPLLAAGAGLSALVGSSLDAGIVAGVGGVNALIGGTQRFRTERAIRTLVAPAQHNVRVWRDGRERMMLADDLVPGDVIELSAGDLVPADCRLLEAEDVEVDSASLTGESLPSQKYAGASFEPNVADRRCMLYAGTDIVAGRARAVVVAVGARVEAERGARLIGDTTRQISGIEARLRDLVQLTGPIAAVGGLSVVAAGMLRGVPAQELVASGVSLAVAAIPEGLPLLASAAQLSTAERLSKRGALVRNARCIEALGRVDVICLDKTGTVTDGHLDLFLISDGETEHPVSDMLPWTRGVLASALRACAAPQAKGVHRDPTDRALARAGERASVTMSEGVSRWRMRSECAFESGRGYHAVIADTGGCSLASIKGAPERVLSRCTERLRDGVTEPITAVERALLFEHAARLAGDGLRVLAVAERELPDDAGEALDVAELGQLRFKGFLAFHDPARAGAADAVRRLRAAGVQVVMLTGDHASTAARIASDVGISRGRDTLTGGEIARLDDEDLDRRIEHVRVFARVAPAQKARVVRALQRRGRVVAMVGDGANDAPALRAAQVGIAFGDRSAAAARASADIVFSTAGLEILHASIIEARAMWLSVRDAVSILVGGNLGEIGFSVIGGLLSGRPPINPRQILLVNFLTDVAPAMAVALRRPSAQAYTELSTRRPDEALKASFDREIIVRALSTTLGASSAWTIGRLTGTRSRASTIALAALVGTQLGQTVLSRGAGVRVLWTSVASWTVLVGIIQTPGLSQLFGCRPMGPVGWTIALGSSVAATGTSFAVSRGYDRAARRVAQYLGRPIKAKVTVVEREDPGMPDQPLRKIESSARE
jgi:cation-transporting P-type ATPase I